MNAISLSGPSLRSIKLFASPFRSGAGAHNFILIAFGLGIALRLATLIVPHSFFPDEIFQYLEAAHRLVFGPGVVPWEYRYHIRSWIFPLLLSAPMELGGLAAPDSTAYLLVPKIALLTLSLVTIGAAASLGRKISPLHALFGSLVAATWYELVYFSSQALTEAAAIPVFLAAAALLYRRSDDRRSLCAAGFLFGLSILLRFQYGPAIATFALLACVHAPRRLIWLTIGGTIALAASGAVDLAMGQRPYAWLIENFHQNIALARSHAWVSGPLFYPQVIVDLWGVWTAPLLLLATIGARRYPALFLCALANIVIHSLIAHKEYRYILLSTALLALLAAIGTADALIWLRNKGLANNPARLSLVAGGIWLAASASIAGGGVARSWWVQGTPPLRAFDSLRRMPGLCGAALARVPWTETGGYAYLHRAVPILLYDDDTRLARETAQFNAIMAKPGYRLPAGFTQRECFNALPGQAGTCVYVREGDCSPLRSDAEINRTLIRLDR